jgi:hypothetical protein
MQFQCDYCNEEFESYVLTMTHESKCKVINLNKIGITPNGKKMISTEKAILMLIKYLNISRDILEYNYFSIGKQYKNDIQEIKEKIQLRLNCESIQTINQTNELIYFKIKY